jgi:hypothetical protein
MNMRPLLVGLVLLKSQSCGLSHGGQEGPGEKELNLPDLWGEMIFEGGKSLNIH